MEFLKLCEEWGTLLWGSPILPLLDNLDFQCQKLDFDVQARLAIHSK